MEVLVVASEDVWEAFLRLEGEDIRVAGLAWMTG